MNVARKSLIPLQLATLAMVGVAGAGTAHASTAHTTPASAPVSALKCGKNPAHNAHLSRATILKRGKSWVTAKVPYSQKHSYCNSYGRYRADCSGFVSMAWGLHAAHWTGSLLDVSKNLSSPKKVAAGDALTHYATSHAKGHVALVVSKTTKGVYVYAEPHTGSYAQKQYWSWTYVKNNHYYGIRYDNVK